MIETRHSFLDSALIGRAQRGDAAAMEDLLGCLRPDIFRYCRFKLASYGGGIEAADDAAQETCLAISMMLNGYRDEGAPFKAWVYAIAANKVTDSQRRYGRSAVLVDEFPEQVDPTPTPEELAISSLEVRVALKLTERLPPQMRQVLLLRAAGASAKSVAEQLGMSSGAVDVNHHRAVTKLRQLVADSDEHRELFAAFGRRIPAAADSQAA
ncbi:MAG: sigma-70 family RNA polymerase sigma factor [Propionibacteriaceae bacterium]